MASFGNMKIGNRITTGICTLTFIHIKEPDKGQYGNNSYHVTGLVPKDSLPLVLGSLREECIRVAKEAFPDTDISTIIMPWQSGDGKVDKKGQPYEGFAGAYWFKAKLSAISKKSGQPNKKPQVFGPDGTTEIDAGLLHPGCLAVMSVTPHSWSKDDEVTIQYPDGSRKTQKETKRGVGLWIGRIQYAGEGKRFKASTGSGEEGFKPIEGVAAPGAPTAASTPSTTPAPQNTTKDELPW